MTTVMTPQPPALPAVLLKPWPVIVVIAAGWLIATVLAFTVPGAARVRPYRGRRARRRRARHIDFSVATSRRAPRIARGAERTQTEFTTEEDAMAAPLLQAQIDIDAPVAKVWALVSDLSRMPQWSPQCRVMKALGGPLRQGSQDGQPQPAQRTCSGRPRAASPSSSPRRSWRSGSTRTTRCGATSSSRPNRHPPDGDPPRRERHHGLLQHDGQHHDGRCAEFRARARRRHEASLARIKAAAES